MDARKARKLAQLQELIDSVPAQGFEEEQHLTRTHDRCGVGARRAALARNRMDEGEAAVERPSASPAKTAFKRVVDLCSYHEFCCMQMRTRLKRDGLPDDAIEHAISDAVRIGLIDDVRWGEMRASALMRKGKGIPGIERELQENGITPSSIDGWPAAYEERFGCEFDRALRILEKNPPRSKNIRGSAYAKLVRKGYSSAIASKASAAWVERIG